MGIAGLLKPYKVDKNCYSVFYEIQKVEYLFIQLIVRHFQSLFGMVSCVPGGFYAYKICKESYGKDVMKYFEQHPSN